MPAPPSNPLSMLRKLGTTLVGRDGLLTNAASTALGYSPMDRVKNRLAAQQQVQGEVEFKNKIAQDERRAKADELALETNRYELDRTKAVNTREDAARRAKGGILAAARVPGPPNPDGSPIIDPDVAIGMAEGDAALNALNRSSGMEVLTPALDAQLRKLGIDPGAEIGQKIDSTQLKSVMDLWNANEGRQSRLQAARESAAGRAVQRDAMLGLRRDQLRNALTTTLSGSLQSNPAYKKFVEVGSEANSIKSLLDRSEEDPNGTTDIAIINFFQRLIDPAVSVREGDAVLLQSAQGLFPRLNPEQVSDWVSQGNRLTRESRTAMRALIDPILEARAKAARDTVRPLYNRATNEQLNLDEIFPAGLFPPEGEDVPYWQRGGGPTTPPSSPSAPTAPATGSRLDNLRKKYLQPRP